MSNLTVLTSPVGYVNHTPEIMAYFENANRVAQYLDVVAAWKAVAIPMANIGQVPPPPPTPPFAVIGYTDSTGNSAVKETNDPVYPAPVPIVPKASPLPGTCGIRAGLYQEPGGRIWVPSTTDTEPVGTKVKVSGIPGIKDGTYIKVDASSAMPSWTGPGFYDPA